MLSAILSLVLAFAPVPTTPPVQAQCGKSGTTIFVPAPPPYATVGPNVLPAATGPVVVTRDGRSVALVPGPVDERFWSFSLPPGERINPGELLRIKAPAEWAKGLPELDIECRNSAGRLEFDIPAPTMGLGLNLTHHPLNINQPCGLPRNWATRLQPWSPESVATDSAGNVAQLKVIKGIPAVARAQFTGQSGNSVDANSLPLRAGRYTVSWESDDPDTELGIDSAEPTWVATPRPDLAVGKGGEGRPVWRSFDVTRGPTAARNRPILRMTVSHPKGTPSYRLPWIFPPGNPLDRSDKWAIEQSVLDQFDVGGGRGPSIIRFTDGCLSSTYSSLYDAADLPDTSKTSWVTPGRTIAGAVVRIRPVDLASNPAILTPSGPIPFKDFTPWFYSDYKFVFEVETKEPHGLVNGQFVQTTFQAPPMVAYKGTAFPVARPNASAWVTGPNTYIAYGASNLLPRGIGPVTIDAPVDTPGGSFLCGIIGDAPVPYEMAGRLVSQWRDTIAWIGIPVIASDAAVDEIARRVLSTLAPGHKVVVEYGNECWNMFFRPTWYCFTMAKLQGGNQVDFYLKRSLEVADRFRAIFAEQGRRADVLSLLAWTQGPMGVLLRRAAELGLWADVVSVAPYWEASPAWMPTIAAWTTEQVHDYWRHYLAWGGWPSRNAAAWETAVADYERAAGHRVLRYSYEGGIDQPWPVSIPRVVQRAYDFWAHPDAYDTERIYQWDCQRHGHDITTYYGHCLPVIPSGTSYGVWNWQGQFPGRGDGSDGRAVNQFIGDGPAFPAGNVSVRGQAWREWQRAYWMNNSRRNDPVIDDH